MQEVEEEETVDVTVKTAASSFELRGIRLSWPVRRLLEVVERQLAVDTATTAVRLLHGGRLLTEHALLGTCLVQRIEGRCTVHAALSERRRGSRRQRAATAAGMAAAMRGAAGDVAVDMDDVQPSGFERLRDAGFTAEEVEELRQQFVAIHGQGSRELEERWLGEAVSSAAVAAERVRQAENDADSSAHLHEHLFGGLVLGFVFPPLLLVGFFMAQASLSKHARVGLSLGALTNMCFFVVTSFFN